MSDTPRLLPHSRLRVLSANVFSKLPREDKILVRDDQCLCGFALEDIEVARV